jgi:3-hydroxybutyryl-CoA dehydrogenase
MDFFRETKSIKTVAVVGAGNMGRGIAQVFAQTGRRVNLTDADESIIEKSLIQIERNVNGCVEGGLISSEKSNAILSYIMPFPCLDDALRDADYVVESINENLYQKQRLFCEIDEACPPDVIITSNTSGLRIADITADLSHPERTATTHFWMPAHLIPIVEVVSGEKTNPSVVIICCDLLTEAGKKPVVVCKDAPGFIGNRMQHALVREAISIVEEGIASAKDVDTVARLSFGLRLPITGPLEAMDLAGLDLVLDIQSYLLKYLSTSKEPARLLRCLVREGKVGSRSGQGFHNWTPEQVEAITRRREEDLIARIRAIDDDIR